MTQSCSCFILATVLKTRARHNSIGAHRAWHRLFFLILQLIPLDSKYTYLLVKRPSTLNNYKIIQVVINAKITRIICPLSFN